MKNIEIAWISGMPRSGTTWLSQIFASSPDVRLKNCPLFSYEFKNALDENSKAKEWENLFYKIYQTNSEFLDQEHLRKHGLVPSFIEKKKNPKFLVIKSNRFHNLTPYIIELNKNIRFIYIVRHPCAAIYSWISDPSEFPANADPIKEWKTGNCRKIGLAEFWGFEDWKKVTLQALRLSEQYPLQHKIIRYEDLLKNTHCTAKKLFQFLNIPYGIQSHNFINLSCSTHDERKHSVFKVKELKDKWQEKLDPSIALECLNDIKNTELEQFTNEP